MPYYDCRFPEDYISVSHWGMFPYKRGEAQQFIPYRPMPLLEGICQREMPPKSPLYA